MTTLVQFPKPISRAAEKADKKAAKDRHRREVYKAVDLRDGFKCRACNRPANPGAVDMLRTGHRHHVVFRSLGGIDDTSTLALLCALCHSDVHAHRLLVSGNADGLLTFERDGKVWKANPPTT